MRDGLWYEGWTVAPGLDCGLRDGPWYEAWIVV